MQTRIENDRCQATPNQHTQTLLERLKKVRSTGPGRWIAQCSAHDDKSPSLAIRETDSGKILVHCFAGCSVDAVVRAIGLELGDLFPLNTAGHSTKPERRPFPAADILQAIAFEVLVVQTSGCALLTGEPFSDADRERLVLAVARIGNSLDAGGLSHG